MQIIDTHCHIHDPEFASKYEKSIEQIIDEGKSAGVVSFVSVGTSAESSRLAVAFAQSHPGTYASLALHPHEVSELSPQKVDADFTVVEKLAAEMHPEVVAIGECGLDYFYHPETEVRDAQKALFRRHIELAQRHNLPLIFHIRDAFDDFFELVDEFNQKGPVLTGIVHSFTAQMEQLTGCLERGFYIGINGIMTFTKIEAQLEAAKAIPRSKLVFETDAPFLTPTPFRGKMCELHHIVETVKFIAALRGETPEELAVASTDNAKRVFKI